MNLQKFSYLFLYTIAMGLIISMVYVNALNIEEEDQTSRITWITILVGFAVLYVNSKGLEFIKLLKYTSMLFVGVFVIYVLGKFIGSFAGYDLISYHGIALFSTLFIFGYLVYYFS